MLSTEVIAALASLAETATGEFTIDELLHELCALAAQALEVDGAGVMISERGELRFIHAAPDRVTQIESLQQILQRGPCRDSMSTQAAVVVEDITETNDWPEFTEASADAGLRSCVAMPLLARGEAWGALDVYRNSPSSWTEEQLALVRLFAGLAASYLVMASDRDLAREARLHLQHQATHDDLTGLPGRTLLFTLLHHALATARRRETAVAVLFVDLDRFKGINDTFGHAAGDAVLVEVTRRMKRALRDNDVLARLAGDEFVIVCEDLPRHATVANAELETIGHRLDLVLREPMAVGDADVVVSVSIGVAVTADHTTTEDLLGEADAAMYLAKQRGRGRLVIGGQHSPEESGSRHSLARELDHALTGDQLRVHYQPIVATDATRTVVAVEALVRWEHPEHGLLSADAFVGLAEQAGTIRAMGRWVIDQVCAQLADWQNQFADGAPRRAFVNLSPREIADPDLDAALAQALATHGISADCLGLEIIEDNFVDALLVPRLAEHHDRGHPLAIDDFGTGYSSLARLVNCPVQYAKIDRAFVSAMSDGPRQRTLIETIVSVAHHLDLTVIAEGVETPQQVIDLTAAGCDLLQGYHLARPQPPEALTAQWHTARS